MLKFLLIPYQYILGREAHKAILASDMLLPLTILLQMNKFLITLVKMLKLMRVDGILGYERMCVHARLLQWEMRNTWLLVPEKTKEKMMKENSMNGVWLTG